MIKPSSCKAKGRKAQQEVRDAILARFPDLTEDDVRSCPMGSHGSDIQLSAAAKAALPIEIEVKARAAIDNATVYDALRQAATHGDLLPVAIIRPDRRPEPFVALRLGDFLDLMTRIPRG